MAQSSIEQHRQCVLDTNGNNETMSEVVPDTTERTSIKETLEAEPSKEVPNNSKEAKKTDAERRNNKSGVNKSLYLQPVSLTPPPRKKPCSKSSSKYEKRNEKTNALPGSYIFIERPGGKIYRLDFKTTNANIATMYVHPRKPLINENEKAIQPLSVEGLTENYGLQFSRLCTLRRTYRLLYTEDDKAQLDNSDKSQVTNSAPSSRSQSPVTACKDASTPNSLRVYHEDQFIERENDKAGVVRRSNTSGAIYVEHKGYVVKVRCEMQCLTSLRPPSDKDIQEKLEKLRMEPTAHRKNKGELWTRCGNDLLKIQFDMTEVNVTKMELKEEVSLQTKSNLIYIRDISPITGKTNYIPVPETTYIYEDPMPSIHRVHLMFKQSNAVPAWKYQLLQERLAAHRGVDNVNEAHERLFSRTRGSRMLFDAFDALAAINMGLLCSEVLRGEEIYEDEQRQQWHNHLISKNPRVKRNQERYSIQKSQQKTVSAEEEPQQPETDDGDAETESNPEENR